MNKHEHPTSTVICVVTYGDDDVDLRNPRWKGADGAELNRCPYSFNESENVRFEHDEFFDVDNFAECLIAGARPGALMAGAFLEGADFRGANLCDANFERAILRMADLSSADLSRANFAHADLTFADLECPAHLQDPIEDLG